MLSLFRPSDFPIYKNSFGFYIFSANTRWVTGSPEVGMSVCVRAVTTTPSGLNRPTKETTLNEPQTTSTGTGSTV